MCLERQQTALVGLVREREKMSNNIANYIECYVTLEAYTSTAFPRYGRVAEISHHNIANFLYNSMLYRFSESNYGNQSDPELQGSGIVLLTYFTNCKSKFLFLMSLNQIIHRIILYNKGFDICLLQILEKINTT